MPASGQPNRAPSRPGAVMALAFAPVGLLILAAILLPGSCQRPPPADTNPPAPYVVAYPANGKAPLRVRLDGSGSTDDVGITAFHWDFGDGTEGDGPIVDHVYRTAGDFDAELTVVDAAGNTRAMSVAVAVSAPKDTRPPVARFAASPERGTAPLTVDFDSRGATDDHAIARVQWHFDDGERAEGTSVRHVFAVPGRYEVTETVSDLAGNEASRAQVIAVEPGPPSAPPHAVMHVNATAATAPADVEFDGSGSTDDRGVVQWEWFFGDGDSARGKVVRHRYVRAGRFTATLVVRDDAGQSDRASTGLEVRAPLVTTERVLFDDAFAPGLTDGSWAKVALTETNVHAGRRALEVTPPAHGAFRIAFPAQKLEAWDRVGFWIRAARPESVSLRAVYADGGREVLGPEVPLAGHLLGGEGGQLSDVWRRGAVPLSALGADHREITGFAWQAGADAMPFALDDLGLVPPDAELPVLSDCAMPPPIRGFVERHGTELVSDGVPFRATGANLYYLQMELSRHVQTGEVRPLANVRAALSAAGCSGATVVRLLAFNDNPPEAQDFTVIQPKPGVYREEGLLGLDLAVAEAKARHLRVILTLTNNWGAYGGLPRYAQWAHVAPEHVLQDAQVKEWLTRYAEMLAHRVNAFTGVRYDEEPAILAVEVANELRCRDCAAGHDATAFATSMAKTLRELFPNQLIADGGEGFDDAPSLYPGLLGESVVRGAEGTSFHTIAQSPDVDLVSYHLYPESWGLDAEEATAYIDEHESVARSAGKVAYMGEFGEKDGDAGRAVTYERWLDRLFNDDAGSLGLVWQVTYPGRPDNDGFALIPGESPLSMAALARAARFLAPPGLEGVSVATR